MRPNDKKLAKFKQLKIVIYNVKDRVILTGRASKQHHGGKKLASKDF